MFRSFFTNEKEKRNIREEKKPTHESTQQHWKWNIWNAYRIFENSSDIRSHKRVSVLDLMYYPHYLNCKCWGPFGFDVDVVVVAVVEIFFLLSVCSVWFIPWCFSVGYFSYINNKGDIVFIFNVTNS